MNKNYKVSIIVISLMFLLVAPKYISNKQEKRNITKNIDDSYKDFNEEDIILPLGFDNKIDMITWSMVNGKINDIPKEESMKISEYVDIMIHLLDKDIYKNNLAVEENLPETFRTNSKYKMLYNKGLLSAFSEEEIINDDVVTINHFTRTMSSILSLYKPYKEYSEKEDELNVLSSYPEIDDNTSECRRKKVLHLIQNDVLPVNYKGEIAFNKPLTELDILILTLRMEDSVRLEELEDSEVGGCLPCKEEVIINERERR